MIYNNILEAMGNTPIVRLNHMTGPEDAEILVKYEGMNVGGSIKTRTALKMIEAAEQRGLLHKDSIIVEPTSGNQGIGLALVGAVKGYRVIIIMPDSVSVERRLLVSQYGAEIRLVHDDNDIGEAIENCIKMAKLMKADDPNVFFPDQFSNRDNLRAHEENTALEILEQIRGPIDGFCSGVGTGGTITGIGKILREHNPNIRIWACEPENAAILSGGNIGTHLQMGIGDGVIPPILDQRIYQDVCLVSDEEAMETTKRLAKEEGILCGISSGTNVCVAMKMAKELGAGRRVVTILPDTGERYFSTPLFNHSVE
ncbi:MAG: cysteine synthase A [Firmicutes bacterium]|nr:cysteine synthase A [Bacillota bacterium]